MVFAGRASACSAASRYAIVDEVDSILIDEARTPLIISGQADDNVDLYYRLNELAPKLVAPGGGERAGRLLGRREGAPGAAVRGRATSTPRQILPTAGLLAGGREPLRRAQHRADAPPVRGAARARAVPPRPALRRAERRGDHRRRVHRPPDVRPALVRRPAPGGRGEGRRADPAREPDARLDHVPELLPHVRQARRHDRHGRHRGVRVPADLPPRDGGDPDAPCRWCARTRTTWCSARSQEKVDAIIADIKDCHERGQPVLVGTTSIENSEMLVGPSREGRSCRTRC